VGYCGKILAATLVANNVSLAATAKGRR